MPSLATKPRLKCLQDRGLEETQWNLVHARYQGWMLARFLSPDVVVPRGPQQDPQGWNRYTYGGNNPVTMVDPDGRSATLAAEAAAVTLPAVSVEVTVGAALGSGVLVGTAVNKIPGVSEAVTGAFEVVIEKVWPIMAENRSKGGKKDTKKPKPHVSGKEVSKDVPCWASGNRPKKDESGKEFATRLMNEKYGKGKWKKSSKEFSRLKEYADRSFVRRS